MKYPVCENILKKFLFCVAVIFLAAAAESREITDMVGRKVIVPEIIRRVYSSMPPVTYMIYAVDPDLLIGLDSLPTEHERKELQKKLSILPRIKGSPGQGHTVNVEVLLKMKPDVVVIWNWKQKVPVENPQFDEIMHKAGIPVVYMTLDSVSDYPEAFLFLGRLLGREERARTLSKYGKDAFSETHRTIAAIPSGNLPGGFIMQKA